MCDFDLSQALSDDSPGIDEPEFKSCCFHMKDLQDNIFTLDDGLELVVSHDPKTMQCIATLLLAVNRLKRPLTRCCREINDGELCSSIMESLVEETIVKKTENLSMAVRRIFQRVNSEKMLTLTDSEQKDIVCGNGELKLEAITLRGGNCERKVNFKLERYITPCVSPGEGQPVVLSITNNNMHISCTMNDGKAVLKLEECCEETLSRISDDGNMDRFLFYRRITGMNLTTFESVKCPGWFISTSYECENQPVEMCKANTVRRVTCFKTN
ncbi:Interleukin-1 beta Precursor [Larimichthys crocea]|uniref:Interleukin-1 n=2 Tax=Larimichthys crocea TaxID=215358 RepID=A0A6G0I270_LARCR|nr:Interleukin-1 beta Precursor [Larimichthys crocea]